MDLAFIEYGAKTIFAMTLDLLQEVWTIHDVYLSEYTQEANVRVT